MAVVSTDQGLAALQAFVAGSPPKEAEAARNLEARLTRAMIDPLGTLTMEGFSPALVAQVPQATVLALGPRLWVLHLPAGMTPEEVQRWTDVLPNLSELYCGQLKCEGGETLHLHTPSLLRVQLQGGRREDVHVGRSCDPMVELKEPEAPEPSRLTRLQRIGALLGCVRPTPE